MSPMVTDSKQTVVSILRESRYLALQDEIRRLEAACEQDTAPLRSRILVLEQKIKTIEFSRRMSYVNRDAAGSRRDVSNKLVADDAEAAGVRLAAERARKRLKWVEKVWREAIQTRRSELDRVERSMRPEDNLLRTGEIGVQQAEPPPSPTFEHES